jgi:hypothetical protein
VGAANDDAIRSAQLLVEAMRNVRLLLEQREMAIIQSLEIEEPPYAYGDGDPVATLRNARIDENREELDEALYVLKERRRQSRVASFRAALDHGLSVDELSEIWRISPKLASDYANEARTGTGSAEGFSW